MEWLDVVLFGVIVMVGYGFARMGFRLCSRPAVELIKKEKDAESKGTEGGVRDDFWSKLARLVPGVFFAGFGMAIIWMAIDRYLPLALDGEEDRPSPAEVQTSEVMGEVVLKVTVLRPTSSTGESEEQETPTVPKVRVQVEKLSLGSHPLGTPGGQWQWRDVAHQKPLPRPSLFAGHP